MRGTFIPPGPGVSAGRRVARHALADARAAPDAPVITRAGPRLVGLRHALADARAAQADRRGGARRSVPRELRFPRAPTAVGGRLRPTGEVGLAVRFPASSGSRELRPRSVGGSGRPESWGSPFGSRERRFPRASTAVGGRLRPTGELGLAVRFPASAGSRELRPRSVTGSGRPRGGARRSVPRERRFPASAGSRELRPRSVTGSGRPERWGSPFGSRERRFPRAPTAVGDRLRPTGEVGLAVRFPRAPVPASSDRGR